jgi:23S rRNA pseudouridine1911/1915/1917 synthase
MSSRFEELLEILYEDNHLIAVNKPCGWPSAHFDGEDETIDRLVKAYIKEKYQKPGNVFLGVVHRIDKPVSGVLLFAKTSKAASRLSEQFRDHLVEKTYWAMVEGEVKQTFGTLEDWLLQTEQDEKVRVVESETPGSKEAILTFQTRFTHSQLSWLELKPQTGRKHQLRVQCSHHGHPIYGDYKYGSKLSFGVGIGLHARSLSFLHPTKHEPITLIAEVPNSWNGRFAYLLQRVEES